MELLFVILISFGLGLGARYFLPGRHSYGSMLIPSVSAALTAVVWVALVWVGWAFDGGWIWVVSLVVGGAAALALAIALPRRRGTADASMLQTLSRA
jgi:hypothetical protein